MMPGGSDGRATLRSMTPAITALRRAGVTFRLHEYEHDGSGRDYGLEAARVLEIDPQQVFKTLVVTVADQPETPAVVIVPAGGTADLKAVGTVLGVKRVVLCDRERAEKITGYVLGGISPIGQRRRLRTVIDDTCGRYETVYVSAGRRGLEIELTPGDLIAMTDAVVAAVAVHPDR